MSLLQPAALLLFALAGVLLFLALRRQTGRRVVSNLYLWRAAQRPDALQLRRRRFQRNLLVALQVAIMSCLILALARPVLEVGQRDVVFVVDLSASMGARDGTGTRLDSAKAHTLRLIDPLPAATQIRLLAAAAAPIDMGVFRAADPRLRLAISGLEATAGGAAIEQAVQLVKAAGDGRVPIYIFSDMRGPADPAGDRIHWFLSGTAQGNLAVSALSVRRLPELPDTIQVLTTIRNYSDVPRETEVEWSADGQAVGRRRLRIAAGRSTSVTLPLAGEKRTIAARLLAQDALNVDNQRFAVIPEHRLLRVKLITSADRFLESALRVDTRVALDVVSSERATDDPQSIPYDVVVCDRCEAIPAGSEPVLLVGPSTRLTRLSASADPLARAGSTHPVVAGLQLEDVPISAGEQDNRRVVVIAADLQNSNLPLTVDFPLLVSNAITWLSASDENVLSVSAGSPLRWRLSGIRPGEAVAVAAPDGTSLSARLQGAELTLLDTTRVGRYEIRRRDRPAASFAANPLVDGESDLRTAAPAGAHSDAVVPEAANAMSAVPFLLYAGLVLLVAEWWYRHTRSQSSRPMSTGSMLCRTGVAAAMILCLTGLRVRAGEATRTVAFVVDRSDSISPGAQAEQSARLDEMARTLRAGDHAALIAFAGDAAVERAPAAGFSAPASTSSLAAGATNVEKALDTALAQLQPWSGRRIVLFTDGRETSGDAMRAAAAAAAARVPIDIVVPTASAGSRTPVSIVRVAAPAHARINEPYPVSIELEGPPGGSGEIRMDRSSGSPLTAQVKFDERGSARVTISETQAAAGVYSYGVAAISEEGSGSTHESHPAGHGAVVAVQGQTHALYVSENGVALAPRLRAAGFLTTVVAPDRVPRAPDQLAGFDLVVLDEIGLETVHESAAAAISAHVNAAAGGLMIMGSPRSLSPAGYVRSPLSAAIPIDLRPRSGRRAPSAALVIVFDKSGSMADTAGGVAKIELARQAVLDVVGVMPSTDAVGVIAFSDVTDAIAPLRANHDPGDLAARLRALGPSGATAIGPAIETAMGWLSGPAAASAARRHIVLLSDGRTSSADAQRVRAAIAGRSVELSVVALGDSGDRRFLEEIAQSTGGRAYFPQDLRQLPLLVAREAARVASGWHVDETFRPKTTSHPLVTNGDVSLPPLRGYVVGATKPDAEPVLLTHLEDPLLAAWRFGLGRVAVFTADIRTAVDATDVQQAALDRLWLRTARWITRQSDDPNLTFWDTHDDSGVHLVLEAADDRGGFVNGLLVSADVRSSDGTLRHVVLEQAAPGRYEGFLPLGPAGPYAAAITARTGDAGGAQAATGDAVDRRLLRGFYRTNPESRHRGVDTALLTRIASSTGGRILARGESPFTGARERGESDPQAWLLAGALLLFFLDAIRGRGFGAAAGMRRWLDGITRRRTAGRAV